MIFVDTGAFLALYEPRDQFHGIALQIWPTLTGPLLTSNHVVSETVTRLSRQAGCREAAARAADLYASTSIDIVQSMREDELEAIGWMRKFADQRVSFTDCVSFAMMRRNRVRTAFTFDRHFRDAGFQVIGLK